MPVKSSNVIEEDGCIPMNKTLCQGGQSIICLDNQIGEHYIVRYTIKSEAKHIHNIMNKFIDQCINPHFIKMFVEKRCHDSKYTPYVFHQILERYQGDLSHIKHDWEENKNDIKLQLLISLYSLMNNNIYITDRNPQNVLYLIKPITLYYKFKNKYYEYTTRIFIAHSDFNEVHQTHIITPDIHRALDNILKMCYQPDPAIVDNGKGLQFFLEDCYRIAIETAGINISNYAIKGLLKAMIRKILNTMPTHEMTDKSYWDIDGKII
jgi:hypothetical protein